MADLAHHWTYLQDEWRAAQAAPLSVRRVLLVAALINAYADRLFATRPEVDDILVFRARLAVATPALAVIFDLCAQRADGPRLVLEAVKVPIADYGRLSVEDFMVSLYNEYTVQRVVIVMPDGQSRLAHAVLREAIEGLASAEQA